MRALRKSGWLLGLLALFCALLATTKIIQPGFGASGLDSLARRSSIRLCHGGNGCCGHCRGH